MKREQTRARSRRLLEMEFFKGGKGNRNTVKSRRVRRAARLQNFELGGLASTQLKERSDLTVGSARRRGGGVG